MIKLSLFKANRWAQNDFDPIKKERTRMSTHKFNAGKYLIAFNLILFGYVLGHCSAAFAQDFNVEGQASNEVNSPADATPLNQVDQGWLSDYDTYIQNQIATFYPDLLDLNHKRMRTICARWQHLSYEDRAGFWSALLSSISYFESNYFRNTIYIEPSHHRDLLTGMYIRSEGLLQLSYGDTYSYGYPFDDVSWEKDQELAREDYRSGNQRGNLDRTILSAYGNLNLGLWIIEKNLDKHSKESLENAMAHYWSTMNKRKNVFPKLFMMLKSKAPYCYTQFRD